MSLKKSILILRWSLILPAMVAGYVLGFFFGLFSQSIVQDFDIAMAIGVSVAAMSWVLLPTLIAPTHKISTATCAYALGLMCAIYFAKDGGHLIRLFLVAAASGAVTLWLISAYSRARNHHVK